MYFPNSPGLLFGGWGNLRAAGICNMSWWNQGIYLPNFTRIALLGLVQSQDCRNIEYVLAESEDLFAQFHQDCFAGAGEISGQLEYRVCVGGIRGSIWPSSPGLLCWGWGQSQDCRNIEYILVESGDLFAQFHQGCFAGSGDNLRTIRI